MWVDYGHGVIVQESASHLMWQIARERGMTEERWIACIEAALERGKGQKAFTGPIFGPEPEDGTADA